MVTPSIETAGYVQSDHFLDVGKMITLGKGGQREIADVALKKLPKNVESFEDIDNLDQ